LGNPSLMVGKGRDHLVFTGLRAGVLRNSNWRAASVRAGGGSMLSGRSAASSARRWRQPLGRLSQVLSPPCLARRVRIATVDHTLTTARLTPSDRGPLLRQRGEPPPGHEFA
jgi:hypothetical protein